MATFSPNLLELLETAGPKAMSHRVLFPDDMHDDPSSLAPSIGRAHDQATARAGAPAEPAAEPAGKHTASPGPRPRANRRNRPARADHGPAAPTCLIGHPPLPMRVLRAPAPGAGDAARADVHCAA